MYQQKVFIVQPVTVLGVEDPDKQKNPIMGADRLTDNKTARGRDPEAKRLSQNYGL